jgi:hypothetical protein
LRKIEFYIFGIRHHKEPEQIPWASSGSESDQTQGAKAERCLMLSKDGSFL